MNINLVRFDKYAMCVDESLCVDCRVGRVCQFLKYSNVTSVIYNMYIDTMLLLAKSYCIPTYLMYS